MSTLAQFFPVSGDAALDYYFISVVYGFNLPMDFSCSTGDDIQCRTDDCPTAIKQSGDDTNIHFCDSNRERAGAVTGRAVAAAAVEGAAGAAPDPAGGGSGAYVEGPRLARVELRAAADGKSRRPHCEAAVVGDLEGGRVGAGG
ncbi:Thaumatin-like protein [Dichanthelium oligosanthes]|uniref:Thaumatin-like protein n=1 Tax=Dichanthelium oligosanthes TaxID=888268 RepID=A0A1E5UTK8_9POAL|nr:Thaumatin-like protein [Dichanthelium oligosanthes]